MLKVVTESHFPIPLLCRPPPINRHNLPRNITRSHRSQKEHHRSNLPRLPNPPHRRSSCHNRLSAIKNSLGHTRPEHPWSNGVDAHTPSSPLQRQRAREVDDGRL